MLADKPLPNPPIAQMGTNSPPRQNRSLIDASEKPLRRSPPGKPWEQEEWPVLFPNRPTTPGTLRQLATKSMNPICSSNGPSDPTDAPIEPAERYPLLPAGTYDLSANMEHKAPRKKSSTQSIQRKPLTPPKDFKRVGQDHAGKENAKPKGTPPKTSTASSNQRSSLSPSKVKPSVVGGTIAEKALTKPSLEPRQTRTSSLRAQISAGQAVKDGPTSSNSNKLLDPASSNHVDESTKSRSDILQMPTPVLPGAYPVSNKPSKDSLRSNRRAAPALFVAGSRRPPSRGSLRSESRCSSHSAQFQPPNRPAPPVPVGKDKASPGKKAAAEISEHEVAPRKSSIPVFRSTVSNVVTQANSKLAPMDLKGLEASANDEKQASAGFGIFEDAHDTTQSSLAAIQESPHPAYKLKRLSVSSPEHGPTLKISPSADRIIMGSGSDKENDPVAKKRSKELGRVLTGGDLCRQSNKNRAPARSYSNRLKNRRPSSSQGLPLSASRAGMMGNDMRAKKVKSADLGSTLAIDHLQRLSAAETPESSRKNTGTSTSDDPFFDAQSSLDKRFSRITTNTETEKDSLLQLYNSLPESSSWVEPVQKHLSLTADSDALLGPADVQSIMTQEGTAQETEMTRKQVPVAGIPSRGAGAFQGSSGRKDISLKFAEPAPTTPEHANVTGGSGSLPLRSSSRTAHPDFIGNKSPTSPSGNKEIVPEEFTARQNRLGSLRGHATTSVDTTNLASNRTSVANSMAHESNKSHGSMSKGMLSKVSGLFHKRNSDDSSLKAKKKDKQKAAINGNGSPFPPISEVHPVHRPTLASMRRAVHTNGRASRSPLPDFSNPVAATPPFQSPMPTEVSTTTTLAMQILESARKEQSSPKKERLLELGKIMVDALTQARDAEKAMEEAKQAARKAEVAYALCKKSCGNVSRLVEEWKDEVSRLS